MPGVVSYEANAVEGVQDVASRSSILARSISSRDSLPVNLPGVGGFSNRYRCETSRPAMMMRMSSNRVYASSLMSCRIVRFCTDRGRGAVPSKIWTILFHDI